MKTVSVSAPGKVEIIDTPIPKLTLCEWVRDEKLPASEFISHRFAITQISEALDAVRGRKVIKALLSYS